MAKRSFFGKVRDFFLGPKPEPTPVPKPTPKPKPKTPPPTTRPPRKTRSPEELAAIARRRERDIKAEKNRSKLVDHIEDMFGDVHDQYGPRFNRSTVRSEVTKFDDAFVTQLLETDNPDDLLDLVTEYKADVLQRREPETLFYH